MVSTIGTHRDGRGYPDVPTFNFEVRVTVEITPTTVELMKPSYRLTNSDVRAAKVQSYQLGIDRIDPLFIFNLYLLRSNENYTD